MKSTESFTRAKWLGSLGSFVPFHDLSFFWAICDYSRPSLTPFKGSVMISFGIREIQERVLFAAFSLDLGVPRGARKISRSKKLSRKKILFPENIFTIPISGSEIIDDLAGRVMPNST